MYEKSFITDCEGPLTLNDNAYELANYFLEDGGNLFKILSLYDDYLVDVVKKPNYKAGNTLKLIIPFFITEGLKNEDFIKFSQNNIFPVAGSKEMLNYIKSIMNTYIVSTSYSQYIEALSNFMNFPFENTYYTNVDIDAFKLSTEEINKIKKFKEIILNLDLDNNEDLKILDNIFWEEIPKMSFFNLIEEINVVGGKGKELAIESIIAKDNININEIFYIGDSITDVEPLKFARNHGGISVSFNGNIYSLNVAEIAIVSTNAIVTGVIADIYSKYNKEKVLNFIHDYNTSNNLEELFERYTVNLEIKNKFFNSYENQNYPLIKIITDENRDEILQESSKIRNCIRGLDIGGLG